MLNVELEVDVLYNENFSSKFQEMLTYTIYSNGTYERNVLGQYTQEQVNILNDLIDEKDFYFYIFARCKCGCYANTTDIVLKNGYLSSFGIEHENIIFKKDRVGLDVFPYENQIVISKLIYDDNSGMLVDSHENSIKLPYCEIDYSDYNKSLEKIKLMMTLS